MPGRPRFDAEGLRKLVRQRVDESSIRFVAEEIGITKGGLESFLSGREPYQKTRAKLAGWYERQRHAGDSVRREDVDAAIALLNRYTQAATTKAARQKRLSEIVSQLAAAD